MIKAAGFVQMKGVGSFVEAACAAAAPSDD
jgi:hypothetical protein